MPRRCQRSTGLASCFLSFVLSGMATADDWPQWMGPKRDNVWREEGVVAKFPAGGPRVLWRAPVAGGYAGPAVAEGRVFLADFVTAADAKVDNFERAVKQGSERIICLDEKTGSIIWKHEYPVKYTISYPAGPRCTPTVDGGRVYTLGAEGDLVCFEAATGKVLWRRNLPEDYETKSATWGYASHPLVDGDKLLCVVGGKGSQLVAFNKASGKEIWRALSAPEQGYVPPRIIEAGGRRQLLHAKPDGVAAVDPETGAELWKAPYEADSGSIIMTPVVFENYLFLGGFNNRNLLLQFGVRQEDVKVLWRDKAQHGLSPVNVQPFLDGNVMYGFDESGELMAVELPSGKRLWTTNDVLGGRRPPASGTAFIVRHDDHYWLFTDQGDLVIARMTAGGYTEIDRAKKLLKMTNSAFGRSVVWCAPAYANRHMYVRNDEECIAVDLSAK